MLLSTDVCEEASSQDKQRLMPLAVHTNCSHGHIISSQVPATTRHVQQDYKMLTATDSGG